MSDVSGTRSKIGAKWWILIGLTLAVVILDQATKLIVLQKFKLGETITVIQDFFSFTYVRNTGAAFGILATADPAFRVPFFIVVPLVALLTIGYVFRRIPADDLKLSTALSLVVGGAMGNLIDRVRLGYVVDFLDFHWKWNYHFPAFNIADSAICVGVAVLMFDLVTQKTPEESKGKES